MRIRREGRRGRGEGGGEEGEERDWIGVEVDKIGERLEEAEWHILLRDQKYPNLKLQLTNVTGHGKQRKDNKASIIFKKEIQTILA